jgi:hypothetical protein
VQAVKPEKVADLIRRATELEHELRLVRRAVARGEGNLAAVAAQMVDVTADRFADAAESLKSLASLVTTVTVPDDPI